MNDNDLAAKLVRLEQEFDKLEEEYHDLEEDRWHLKQAVTPELLTDLKAAYWTAKDAGVPALAARIEMHARRVSEALEWLAGGQEEKL